MEKTLDRAAPGNAPRRAVQRADTVRTRTRILRTAERLFAERGFSRVSVRDLAAAAGVNVALIGYHFRSKEGLLEEVYRRHCEPMNEERLSCLAATLSLRGGARVAAIIEAFIRPALRRIETGDGEAFIRLRAVLSGENSELLKKLAARNSEALNSRFVGALWDCLPHLSREDVCWRFHFMLGALHYTAAGPHRILAFSEWRCNPAHTEDVIRELVLFLTRGFLAPASPVPGFPVKAPA